MRKEFIICKICKKQPIEWCISSGTNITYNKYKSWLKDKEDMCIICYCEH